MRKQKQNAGCGWTWWIDLKCICCNIQIIFFAWNMSSLNYLRPIYMRPVIYIWPCTYNMVRECLAWVCSYGLNRTPNLHIPVTNMANVKWHSNVHPGSLCENYLPTLYTRRILNQQYIESTIRNIVGWQNSQSLLQYKLSVWYRS